MMKTFWRKKFSSFLLAFLMLATMIPTASAARADVTYEVDAGKAFTFDISDFYSKEPFDYLVFTEYSDLDRYGYFTAYNMNQDKVTLYKKDLNNLWFYYNERKITYSDDCDLDTLTFVADDDADGTLTLSFELWTNREKKYSGTIDIEVDGRSSSSSSSSRNGDIVYTVEANEKVTLKAKDFKNFFEDSYSNFSYLRFTNISNLDECGVLTTYAYNSSKDSLVAVELDEDDALDGYFYYDDDDVQYTGDYCLDGLAFVADRRTDGEVVELDFTAYGTQSKYRVYGTLIIEIGDVENFVTNAKLTYKVAPQKELVMDEEDFNDLFQKEYPRYDFEYLYFTGSENLGTYNGSMYCNYGQSSEFRLSASNLKNYYFYYDEDDIPKIADHCYPLEDLSFVASEYFDTAVTLNFTACYGSSRQISGTVTISPDTSSNAPQTSTSSASILYTTTTGNNVQLKAGDFSKLYQSKTNNSSTLQSVTLMGVPSTGGLYYNYYSASSYGTTARLSLTAYNCGTQALYLSPANTTQYALSELTYIPSGTNYCASIPFAATGTGGYTVYGSVMISVTSKTIPEVYGMTPKNTTVSFPASNIASAVYTGTSTSLSSIQLLSLPSATVGTVYAGSNSSRAATTSDLYTLSGSSWTISQLRFVPATGYTGNVELPYAAYDANGSLLGVGKFSLGVVNSQPSFTDVTTSTWCYKYVAELTDAGVISGYSDGSFRPDTKISYGAALKLIMRAAGYPELAPTTSGSTFSGYLTRAQADGLITRSNVDLSAPINRLQVAQLAAGALKLDLNNVSSVQPFTDTSDKYVQALYEAGIVEGYFSNGTSAYRPSGTLTRGQLSAIVWRMRNYL